MYKSTLAIISLLALILCVGCKNQSQENKQQTTTAETSEQTIKFGRNNYAVVWKWATDDTELVNDNMIEMSNELTDLWKKDVVENVYYNSEAKIDKLAYFPNISFFIKAKDKTSAKAILNKLTAVTKGISTYELHPVGTLWLARIADEVGKRGFSKSFVTVWSSENSTNSTQDLLQKQNDTVLEYWKSGQIENVYFDMGSDMKKNEKTDFVFFVNANSEEDARKVCESLPFFKEKLVFYKMYETGFFWMGRYEK